MSTNVEYWKIHCNYKIINTHVIVEFINQIYCFFKILYEKPYIKIYTMGQLKEVFSVSK